MMIYDDKQHLLAVCVQTLAECYVYLAPFRDDPQTRSLHDKIGAVITRINSARRGTNERKATHEG